MARSIWKGPFYDISIFKDNNNGKQIWSRRSVIHPSFSGSFISVYNGQAFIKIFITEEMIGHKFGQFVPTKRIPNRTVSKGRSKLRRKMTTLSQ